MKAYALPKHQQKGLPMSPDSIPQKRCSVCGETFPATNEYFHRNKKGKHGCSSRCKECAKTAARQWIADNHDHAIETKRQYTAKHTEENRARAKAWAEAHPEHVKKRHAQYYIEHKEDMIRAGVESARRNPNTKARIAAWVTAHPERRKEIGRESARRRRPILKAEGRIKRNPANDKKWKAIRRAMELNTEGSFTEAELLELYEAQGHRCFYCGVTLFWDVPGDIHADHYHPLSRGGGNTILDIVLACAWCNLSKADKLIREWQAVRGW